MSEKIIRLNEALTVMEVAKESISVEYVAFNRRKGTGGHIVQLERCFKTGKPHSDSDKNPRMSRSVLNAVISRNPNHYENYTRIFKVIPSGKIRKCSIWVII